ncbi:hypothetical protein [Xanthomonas arboricola]
MSQLIGALSALIVEAVFGKKPVPDACFDRARALQCQRTTTARRHLPQRATADMGVGIAIAFALQRRGAHDALRPPCPCRRR